MINYSSPSSPRRLSTRRRQATRGNSLLSVVIAIGLAFLAYIVATANGDRNPDAQPLMALAIFFFAFVMVRGMLAHGGLFCVTYGIYYVLFLTLPGMFNISSNDFPFFGMRYTEGDIYQAAMVVLIFAIAGFCGHMLASWSGPAAPEVVPEPPVRTTAKATIIMAMIVLSLFLVAIIGPGAFLARRNETVIIDFGGGSQLVQVVVQTARTSAIIALIAAFHRWIVLGLRISDLALVLVCLMLNSIANFPLGIPRFNLFAYLLIMMQMAFDVTRPRFKALFIVAVFAGMTTIFPFTSFLQRGQEGTSFEFDIVGYLKSANDLDGFQSVINVVVLVAGEGLSWGWQLLSTILAPVPRSFWPAKGLPTGSIAAANMGYPMVNISAPLPSEMLIDFGSVGVFVGGLIVGYLLTRLDFFYKTSPKRGGLRFYLLYGGVVSYLIILSRGPLLGVIAPIALFFGLSYIITMQGFSRDVRRR